MNFDFGEVLTRAWKIIWKHKVLWIFGILASCGSRSGNSSSNSRSGSQPGDPFSSGNPLYSNEIMRDMVNFFEKAAQWFKENLWVIFALIGFIVLMGLIQIFITTIGHIGLIRGAYHAELGAEKIRFGELFGESFRYFSGMIGLSLAIWGPIIVALIVVFTVFIFSMSGQTSTGADPAFAFFGLFFLAFCCCLFPVMIALGLYHTQAMRALILEDLGVFASLSRGWQVFSRNIIGLIVMAVVLFIINLVASVIISVPVYIAVLPLMLKFIEGSVDSWQPVIAAVVILCLYSPIAWFLTGIVLSYVQTVWTLIYMRVTVIRKDEPIMIEANA